MEVQFTFQVHANFGSLSSSDRMLIKKIDMPFAPYVGLIVADGTGWECEPITEVIYHTNTKSFTAYCGENTEIYEAELHRIPHRTLEEIVKDYTDWGWKVDETF